MKAPSTKHQAPEKLQTPSSKSDVRSTSVFDVWNLDLFWSLVLGAWSF
jgi:hypothetical protein